MFILDLFLQCIHIWNNNIANVNSRNLTTVVNGNDGKCNVPTKKNRNVIPTLPY